MSLVFSFSEIFRDDPAVVNKVETWLNMFVSMSTTVLYDG